MTDKKMLSSQSESWELMNKEELELQYSPSKWSKRYSSDEIISRHVEVATTISRRNRVQIPHSVDNEVVYQSTLINDTTEQQTSYIDVYGVDLPEGSSMVVYVHGGYWQELSKELSAYLVKPLYQANIITCVIGYTLAPKASISEIVQEIQADLEWCCELAKERQSRSVTLAGWSAGAQLITQALSSWTEEQQIPETPLKLIRGLITFSGVFDLRPLVDTYVNTPLHLTREEAWKVSPQRTVKSLSVIWQHLNIVITVGEFDSPEFKQQSKLYYETCCNHGLKATFLQVADADHFNMVEQLSDQKFEQTQKLIMLAS